ncbi:hypothetical protein [Paenibacillus rigui]|uniref:LysM domain-containing protein n=1 Tax=Paenibacillus rigui TaxID=554312 RepID=A0A229UT32_9BACL|nr:hypothetical protein [Paenibacillus rigui]OXM86305.1 hypothetical protein CF651_10240 [Paenibacillus rigui]
MKPFGKKMITGTIAASFLLGGGLVGSLYTPQANAADAASASVQNKSTDGKGQFGNRQGGMGIRGGGPLLSKTATILGVEQSVIQDELKAGKTLAQIAQEKASLSEEDFLAKLVAAETAAIDADVTAGKLTQEQADKRKENLSDRLKKEIENTGMGKGGFGGPGGGPEGGPRGGGKLVEEAATILGVEQSVIQDELKAGKTLAQIAQEKASLSEDDFLAKLVAAETAAIDAEVTAGKLTQDQADKRKENLSDRLKKEIENAGIGKGGPGGFGGEHGKGGGFFGNQENLATLLGLTKEELQTELKAGKSLAEIAEAKGISKDSLISQIKDSLTDQITKMVDSKKQPRTEEGAAAASSAAQ